MSAITGIRDVPACAGVSPRWLTGIAANLALVRPDYLDPVGVLAFHERVHAGPIHLLMAAFSTVVLAAAVVVLARSPLLSDDQQQDHEDGQSRRRPGDQPRSESPHPARS